MVKIGVNLGLTLCTDPQNRNFVRVGCEISDIDLDHDIELQAKKAVDGMVKVFSMADEGLQHSVYEVLVENELPQANAGKLFFQMQEQLDNLEKRLLPNLVDKIKTMDKQINPINSTGDEHEESMEVVEEVKLEEE